MAEIIAIIVCALIILTFVLACFIMIRNTQKRKNMAALKAQKTTEDKAFSNKVINSRVIAKTNHMRKNTQSTPNQDRS